MSVLDMAVGQSKPKDVIHHSDQGCQYTSLAVGSRRKEVGVRPSMGSVVDAYDNAMAESVFSILERELLNRRSFTSQAEARVACFTYIEAFHNPLRLHSGLGYRSPIDYETSCHHAQANAMINRPKQVHRPSTKPGQSQSGTGALQCQSRRTPVPGSPLAARNDVEGAHCSQASDRVDNVIRSFNRPTPSRACRCGRGVPAGSRPRPWPWRSARSPACAARPTR